MKCGNKHITGDNMYFAEKVKKTKMFQPAFSICGNNICITDTVRAKKKFLKSGIKDVCFGEEFANDDVFVSVLKEADEYDYEFALTYLDGMIQCVTEFFGLCVPLECMGVFSDDTRIMAICMKYAKMITVAGKKRESEVRDGVIIRYVKKIKNLPDIVITDGRDDLSPVFKVPKINLGKSKAKSSMTLSPKCISFKTNIFPFDIGMGTLLYFLKKGEKVDYEVTSFRKKTPTLFTFG